MGTSLFTDPDALPQLIGEFQPVDIWQAHINRIFYGLQGGRLREYYQTFASADYRLAHALATDYFQKVVQRDRARGERAHSSPLPRASRLTIMEWGAGNGNLAACFLTHLKHLDKEELVYPRVRYVLVEDQEAALKTALTHPDLAEHRARVETLCADVTDLGAVKDGTVDCILCNELWNDLPAKLMLRKEGEVQEEFIRPNLSEGKYAAIGDWSGFVKAFTDLDIQALRSFPTFLEDIIWEKEYRKIEWKDVPFRKTLTEFLKQVDEHVLVPVLVALGVWPDEQTVVLDLELLASESGAARSPASAHGWGWITHGSLAVGILSGQGQRKVLEGRTVLAVVHHDAYLLRAREIRGDLPLDLASLLVDRHARWGCFKAIGQRIAVGILRGHRVDIPSRHQCRRRRGGDAGRNIGDRERL